MLRLIVPLVVFAALGFALTFVLLRPSTSEAPQSTTPAGAETPGASTQPKGPQTTQQPTLPLPPADVDIGGTITYPDGSPAAGIEVELVTVNPDLRPKQETDAEGRYRFQGFERGQFWVGIHLDGYLAINQSVIASLTPKHTHDFQLQRLVYWRGLVVDPLDQPLNRVNVRLNNGHPADTTEEGTFLVAGLESDRYELIVQHPDFRRRVFTAPTLEGLPDRITLIAAKKGS